MAEPIFGRTVTAMITPFDADNNLDINRMQEFTERLINQGAEGLVVVPTTGESPTVPYPEKIKCFEAVVEAAAGRCKVIANTGDNCTQDTIDFTREVEHLALDGIMAVVPYYNKPPQEGLYWHYRSIAEATELPVLLYNIPGRCVINMTAETTLRLAHDVPNIKAIKEASGKFDQVKAICDGAPDDFYVYSGDDSATLDVMKRGGVGVISTIGNVAVDRMKEIVDLAAAGKWEEAQKANDILLPMMDGLFATTNPILVKEALKLVGFPVGGVRLPLVNATQEQSDTLAAIMRQVGVLA